MKEIVMDNVTYEDKIYLGKRLAYDVALKDIIVLILEKQRYYIVAGIIEVIENILLFTELPICGFESKSALPACPAEMQWQHEADRL